MYAFFLGFLSTRIICLWFLVFRLTAEEVRDLDAAPMEQSHFRALASQGLLHKDVAPGF